MNTWNVGKPAYLDHTGINHTFADNSAFLTRFFMSQLLIRDWESLDMCVAGEAESGIEAINTIDDIRPDIAFVDISMPFMDGIQFSVIAADRYPDMIIIIMTAFDKFEYARKCVSLPIFDYMLKPMVRSEVTETLKRAKEKLDERGPAQSGDAPAALPRAYCFGQQELPQPGGR